MNTGQACVAGSRIYVQEGIYDQVLAGLTESAKYWESVTDDPFSPNCQMGPIVSQNQMKVSLPSSSPVYCSISNTET